MRCLQTEARLAEPWYYDVLPCRPPPYAGECLTGYLLRLAEANHLASFPDLVFDLFPLWSETLQLGLLRWEYPVDDWGRLPLRTQLPPSGTAPVDGPALAGKVSLAACSCGALTSPKAHVTG